MSCVHLSRAKGLARWRACRVGCDLRVRHRFVRDIDASVVGMCVQARPKPHAGGGRGRRDGVHGGLATDERLEGTVGRMKKNMRG